MYRDLNDGRGALGRVCTEHLFRNRSQNTTRLKSSVGHAGMNIGVTLQEPLLFSSGHRFLSSLFLQWQATTPSSSNKLFLLLDFCNVYRHSKLLR